VKVLKCRPAAEWFLVILLHINMFVDFISWIDFILVPVYFIILFFLMIFIRKKNARNPIYQKYLLRGFTFRICGALFYGLLIFFYYGDGDSFNYFREAMLIRQQIDSGAENITVLFAPYNYVRTTYEITAAGHEGGWLMERVVILLSYISFSRYLVTTMLFATLTYAGIMKMMETFAEIMPEWHRYIGWIVLFFPSLAVYGSGIMKDTVCISALGWLIYSSHQLINKKNNHLRYMIIFILSATLIFMIKTYIIAAFAIPYILYLVLIHVRKFENSLIRKLIFPLMLGFLLLIGYMFSSTIEAGLGQYASGNLLENVQAQQSTYLNQQDAESGAVFNIGNMEPTLTGFAKMLPAGAVATLYRPFIWESKKVIMLFSAVESLAILLFTIFVIWKAGILGFFRKILNEPFIFLCISFALVFAAVVGLSTLNFGTLARYRIPVLPFYLCGLLMILYKSLMKKTPGENIA
jgi:hypothetical protein